MRLVIAPQAFKGSLDAPGVAGAIAEGLRRVFPEVQMDLVPLADGGEGTVRALVEATGGELRYREVAGPLGESVRALWGILGDGHTAVIEMAAASGLPLLPPGERNPLFTSTYGTGQLIAAALDAGCREFVVGIGGSATNDGGAGMAQALGVRLLDEYGQDLPLGGAALARLARVDATGLDPRAKESRFLVACDVTNPLLGPTGASAVYGPQKGATPAMVVELEAALRHFARVLERDLGFRVADLPGSGAAGGLGAGLIAFLGATLRPGAEMVLEAVHFPQRCAGAALVITGEGRLDAQTGYGKTVAGVARAAAQAGVPVVAIGGGIAAEGYALLRQGVEALLAITPRPMSLEEASASAHDLTADAAEQAARLLALGARLGKRP